MIIDNLKNSERYEHIRRGFSEAFEFLKQENIPGLSPGRYDIDGDRIYAMISMASGKGRQETKLEIHRKYIDIHFVLNGTDEIGWKQLSDCSGVENEFDDEKDYGFIPDEAERFIRLSPGLFAIFFPDDAHAPLSGDGEVKKVVIKVEVALYNNL